MSENLDVIRRKQIHPLVKTTHRHTLVQKTTKSHSKKLVPWTTRRKLETDLGIFGFVHIEVNIRPCNKAVNF